MSNEAQDGVLRLPQVMSRVGLKKSTIYAMAAAGTFPKPFAVGARAVGWLQSDIATFIAHRALRRHYEPRKSALVADQLLECPLVALA